MTDSLGWRWTFWILAIVAGTLSTMFFIFSRETYAPIILQRKVNKMKKDTGNELLRSALPGEGDAHQGAEQQTPPDTGRVPLT